MNLFVDNASTEINGCSVLLGNIRDSPRPLLMLEVGLSGLLLLPNYSFGI